MTIGGLKLITSDEMDLLHRIIWAYYRKGNSDDINAINYFLKCVGHGYTIHEISWMISYAKELRCQFEERGTKR